MSTASGPSRRGINGKIQVKAPGEKLARLINDEFKTNIKPHELAIFITTSWTEISLYAHALHEQLNPKE